MVTYTCDNCNKNFNKKSNYISHLNRKFKCKKVINTFDISLKNQTINNDNINLEIIEKIYTCLFCKKEYIYKQSKYRHQLNCKENKQENLINKLEENIILKDELNIIKEDIKILLRNQNSNNIITNNIINNNNNNNNNNNIIIQYGLEHKTKGLTNEEIIRIVNKGWTALYESIKLTHFNNRLPQLHNIYIPDKKFNTIMIFKDKKFELDKLENVLYDLIDKHIENIKEYLDMDLNFQENRLPIVKQLLDKITEIYDNDNFSKFKNDEQISDILLFLYNNKELVIKNYEKYLNNMIT